MVYFQPQGLWLLERRCPLSLLSEKESIFLCLCLHSQLIQFNVRKTAQLRAERHISKTYGPACAYIHTHIRAAASSQLSTNAGWQAICLKCWFYCVSLQVCHPSCTHPSLTYRMHLEPRQDKHHPCIAGICRWDKDLGWNRELMSICNGRLSYRGWSNTGSYDRLTFTISLSLLLPAHTNKHITHQLPFQ